MSKRGDVSTMQCMERTLLPSTALCASAEAAQGELGHPPARSVSVLGVAGRGLRTESYFFLGSFSICATKSAISRLVVGAERKKRSRISAGAGGCCCGASS